MNDINPRLLEVWGESGDIREPALVALDHMSVEDVLSAARYSRATGLDDQRFFETLEAYPSWTQNLDHARAIYTAHANSPLPHDRSDIGIIMGGLTVVDHDSGLSLWDQLLRDYDPDVRQRTYRRFPDYFGESDVETAFAGLGLTLTEALHLQHNFKQAEQGRNLHDPRRDAYQRFLGRLGVDMPRDTQA